MKSAPFLVRSISQLYVITSIFLLSACDQIKAGTTSAACTSNGTAQIQIFDGGMQRVCGCTEAANTSFGTSGLQCTVTHGATIVFLFPSIQNQHQVGIPTYGAGWSGQYRTASGGLNQSDSLLLNSTGTFSFADIYAGLSGTIIVQ